MYLEIKDELFGKNPNFWYTEVAAFLEALATPLTTTFVNCLLIAEFVAFFWFSFAASSRTFLPRAELRTFFPTVELKYVPKL